MLEATSREKRSERPTNSSAPYSSPAVVQDDSSDPLPVVNSARRKWQLMYRRTSDDSPPTLASASSSAGMTLRAISPHDSTSPNLANAVCGRFGCSGLAGSIETSEDEARSRDSIASSRRASFARGHKHTHSAAAGLNFLSASSKHSLTAKSTLIMTPFSGDIQSQTRVANEKSCDSVKEDTVDVDERAETQQSRGRSKARGRRSTSRRSPSPPRGVARRGRSEDLMKMTSSVSRISRQPSPVSPASARSNPITFSPAQRSPVVEEDLGERRGRSPTERRTVARGRTQHREQQQQQQQAPLAAAAKINLYHSLQRRGTADSCEMAWPAYGHHLDEWSDEKSKDDLAKSVATSIITGAKGYDDVDLDEL